MKDDTVSRAAVLKAIDEYERLSMVSQTVRNMTSLREIVQWLPSVQLEPKPDKNGSEPFGNAEMLSDRTTDDCISRQAAIDALGEKPLAWTEGEYELGLQKQWQSDVDALKALPSVQPQTEWNNHTVACLLAELFGDTCACNFNGIDEWLPEKCEVIDACPNPVGVACWEQFLKHRAERRTDEQTN